MANICPVVCNTSLDLQTMQANTRHGDLDTLAPSDPLYAQYPQ